MQPDENNLSRLSEVIQKSMSGAIVLPTNPSADAIAAATAIYLVLTKIGKTITLVCETAPKSDLVAADKIQRELVVPGDNLVIAFPYIDGSIDKVDYNIQADVFNLIVTPRAGKQKLDPSQVKFSYSGGALDFIITIDTPNLNTLGKIFLENREQFQGKTIINIDRHLVNDFYGMINIVNKTSSSTSELAVRFLKEIDGEIDKDIATNLYAGLVAATNNFSSFSVNADTFETAAYLLRLGALKKQIKKPGIASFPQQPQAAFAPKKHYAPQPISSPQREVQIQHPAGKQNQSFEQAKPIEEVEKENTESQQTGENAQDWLKPKIFRGTGLL
ncbi:hypothetical protein HY358_00780 [Candidatus Roizmanbacteria bacterium]|nr:hypothetical protein [Candidatus Roizmanbacteria bacterium]